MKARLCALMLALSFILGHVAHAQENSNIVQEFHGRIEYRFLDTDEVRGHEVFRLTVHPNGERTIRITNVLNETGVLRDVVMRVNETLKPIDLFISHWKDAQHRGTGYYWATNGEVHAVVNAPNGTLQQRANVPTPFSFATRPQAAFGWHLWNYDFEKGGTQPLTIFVLSKWGLDVGSILGEVREFSAQLIGSERLKVAGAVFDTWHVIIGETYEVWADKETLLAVRLLVKEKNRVYELVEFGQVP
ncbi:hypothetical protein [Lentisalinibacter orientalis]|uniref:hypothetical protein n=1 Tax=Lentisalinibacter orientalis TaxID=2992241 RepID=UPI00386F51C1